jgi:hypothetical protein
VFLDLQEEWECCTLYLYLAASSHLTYPHVGCLLYRPLFYHAARLWPIFS